MGGEVSLLVQNYVFKGFYLVLVGLQIAEEEVGGDTFQLLLLILALAFHLT